MHQCSTRCPTSRQKITQWSWGNTTVRRWPPRKKTVRWLQTLPLRPQVKLWLEGFLQQCLQNPDAPHAKGGRPNACWRRSEREAVPWYGNPAHRVAWLCLMIWVLNTGQAYRCPGTLLVTLLVALSLVDILLFILFILFCGRGGM